MQDLSLIHFHLSLKFTNEIEFRRKMNMLVLNCFVLLAITLVIRIAQTRENLGDITVDEFVELNFYVKYTSSRVMKIIVK